MQSAKFLCLIMLSYLLSGGVGAETLRVTAVTASGTHWHDSWLHFQEQLGARSDLNWQTHFYLGGQMGSEESALSQLQRRRVQLGGFSLQGASAVVPELGLLMSPHLTLTRHAFDSGMYLANRDWFLSLSKARQQHLQHSLMPAAQFRQMVRSYEQNILQQPQKYGIQVREPTPPSTGAMARARWCWPCSTAPKDQRVRPL